jgi:IS30 family transposase
MAIFQKGRSGRNEPDHFSPNGLLRQHLPKGCDLSAYTEANLQQIEDKLNQPKNGIATSWWLGFRTPQRVFDASFKRVALRS